mmetsp:Transcript_27968/g.80825  ORF Transcript_27968/g.80825 Transcript_27968/m.80825 type:complete len:726 (-) Transcript_27968:228-2405(-)
MFPLNDGGPSTNPVHRRGLGRLLPPFLTAPVCSILITEVSERFSYFGFRAILVLYFHEALGYDENKSVAFFAYVSCTAYLTPVFGAIVADSYIGRYRTILWFGLAYFVGLAVLTAGAYLPGFEENAAEEAHAVTANKAKEQNEDDVDDIGAYSGSSSLLLKELLTLVGLAFACIGTGGIKPCVSAFGADQVAGDEGLSSTQKPKATGLECDDRGEVTYNSRSSESPAKGEQHDNVRSFFSFFYFGINVGAVLSISLVPMIRGHYGFGAAFLAPTVFLALAMAVFVSERKAYKQPLEGDDSSLATTFTVFFLLLKNQMMTTDDVWAHCSLCRWRRHHKVSKFSPIGKQSIYIDRRTNQFNDTCTVRNGEQILHNNQDVFEESSFQSHLEERFPKNIIEDARTVLRLAPVLSMLPVFWMLYDQQGSVWTLQATRMGLHGYQPEQLNIINPIEIMVLVPLFEKMIYPYLESRRFRVTHVRRMAVGMFLTSISFVVSGLLESAIETRNQAGGEKISVFWQLPQITILACAEILVSVTGLEYSYSSSPESMKAFVLALYLLTTSIGDLLGGVLYSSVFALLDRAITLHMCAGMMILNLVVFIGVARSYEDSMSGEKNDNNDRDLDLDPQKGIDDENSATLRLHTVDRRVSAALSSPSPSPEYVHALADIDSAGDENGSGNYSSIGKKNDKRIPVHVDRDSAVGIRSTGTASRSRSSSSIEMAIISEREIT